MIREKRTVNCWLLTNKGNCEGKPTKPLQLPFILPIELITAFFNFQKLISSGSASKQNYMMHTGHSCNFIGPFRCITSLSDALQAISEAYFSETQPQWNKKRSLPPPIAEAHLASSSFKKLLSNAEIFISNSNLNTGTFTPKL